MGHVIQLVLAFCGAALAGPASPAAPAQTAGTAAPPPLPLYSASVTKTTIFGPGMIVIDTTDSFQKVRDWYQANLKDRTADVALDAGHHRYVTHDGASVDVAAEGSGPDAGTKISLFWKADAAILASPGPASEPAPTENAQPLAALRQIKPASPAPASEPAHTETIQPLVTLGEIKPASPVAEAQIALATPARVEPLPRHPADAGQSDARPRESQGGAAYLREGRYGEALLAWEDAAANGSAAAALNVGMMYDAGLGVPQNYGSAFSWYEIAAELGDPVAIYNIGVLNDAGLGLSRNPAEAVDRYTQAAAKGIGRAAFNLALLYERGEGVEQDEREAAQYFRKAERLGVRAARAHLQGRRGLRQVDADDSDLPFNTIHSIGGDAPEKHRVDTARMQDQAAQGDPVALYDLAYLLEKGIGQEADPHGAYMMYRQAAYDAQDDRLKAVAKAAAAHLAGGGRVR